MTIYECALNKNIKNYPKTAMCIRLDNGGIRSYTYGQLFALTDAFADALKRAGIEPGDRVAIIAENCPEWCAAYLAVSKLKATAVLIDASLDEPELCKLLGRAMVRCIFTTQKAIGKLAPFSGIPALDILNDAHCFDGHERAIYSMKTTDGNENVSTIIFSSGTTKTASGIMHSHDSLLNTTRMVIENNNMHTDGRFLAILPNSHIYGLICQVIGAMLLESSICFLESLSADALSGAFQDYKPTIFPAVPKVFDLLKTQLMHRINSDPKTKKLFDMFFPKCLQIRKKTGLNPGKVLFKAIHKGFGSHIDILCSAGAPLDQETAEFFYGTGFRILITYGATETNIPTIGNYGQTLTTNTCGKAYPNISVKFGDDGEIRIKSPYMMLGYFDDEAASREAFDEEGFFKTGDLGCVDPQNGCIKILGRCKDNIVLATGKKVAPDDIEKAYVGIEGVKELVVCGIPISDGSYDEVHAFAVTDPSKLELALTCLKQRSASLPHNMKLADIHFVDEIPKTSLQKPKRYLLKQMAHEHMPASILPEIQSAGNDTAAIVKAAIARVAGIDVSEVLPEMKPFLELAIDSLGSIDLCCELEEKCYGADLSSFLRKDMTISDLIECISAPAGTVRQCATERYPMKKNRSDYSAFRIVQQLLRGIYNIKVENDSILPQNNGYIICSNHVSNFDYLFLTLNFTWERFSQFCCMAKKELFSKKLLDRWIVKIAGMVPVDRSNFSNDSFAVVRDRLRDRWGVLIHPEGTRSKNGEMSIFKKGAALLSIEANVPIVPAYIKGGYEVYPRSKKLPKLFNWKERKRYRVEVKYGNPISPEGMNADELIKFVELAVTQLKNSAKVTYMPVQPVEL